MKYTYTLELSRYSKDSSEDSFFTSDKDDDLEEQDELMEEEEEFAEESDLDEELNFDKPHFRDLGLDYENEEDE